MSTHNIHFHDEISLNICILKLSEEFSRTKKQVRNSPGKRVISVRVIEV